MFAAPFADGFKGITEVSTARRVFILQICIANIHRLCLSSYKGWEMNHMFQDVIQAVIINQSVLLSCRMDGKDWLPSNLAWSWSISSSVATVDQVSEPHRRKLAREGMPGWTFQPSETIQFNIWLIWITATGKFPSLNFPTHLFNNSRILLLIDFPFTFSKKSSQWKALFLWGKSR